MTKMYVVLNPVAGSSQPDVVREALRQRLTGADRAYEVYETTGRERLADVVGDALGRGFELVVAAGGDGTVSGVADALAHTQVPLGIVPLGTGNVLARDLEIPIDLDGALDLLLGEHTIQRIDALQVGDRFCVLNVGVGVSGQIMRRTDSDTKRRFGRMAYLWNMVDKLVGLERHRFTLTIDGRQMRVRATEILILNSSALGSPYVRWGTDIRLDNGRVGVFVLRPRAVIDYIGIVWDLLLRRQESEPGLRRFRAKEEVVVRANTPLVVQGDGDVIGQTPVEIEIVPGVVQVIAPPGEKAP